MNVSLYAHIFPRSSYVASPQLIAIHYYKKQGDLAFYSGVINIKTEIYSNFDGKIATVRLI